MLADIFWPLYPKETPGGIARFGRVVHWAFAAGAAVTMIGGIIDQGNNYPTSILSWIAGALMLWVSGRALRYIFSGE